MTVKRAYRLLPLTADGRPNEHAQYTYVAEEEVQPGDRVGDRWEVVEVRSGTGGLIAARDASGTNLPVAGTLVCRHVTPA